LVYDFAFLMRHASFGAFGDGPETIKAGKD
jgi:hypothetical protein